ncbi:MULTISPECIES: hypothetical protein [Streptomyces]|uniref:hypothetical protein n=1 Tax=Streptomyces TaxID=1883 RepID=UPI001319D49B|nr:MULTISPECIES: hypothetical protein [Streptomyces]MZD21617.1 hypothetical protein [Streptomyces sp. SID5476]
MSEALIAAIAALVGGLGGSLIGARAAVLAARAAREAARETSENARSLAQEEWFRGKRYEIYTEALDAAQKLLQDISGVRLNSLSEQDVENVMSRNQSLMMALGKIVLVGPPQVILLGKHLAESATSAVQGLMMLRPDAADPARTGLRVIEQYQRTERLVVARTLFEECAGEVIRRTREFPFSAEESRD